jgi:hypothetical protein
MNTTNSPTRQTNRRQSRRFPASGTARVECRKGTIGLGPNLVLRALDISETGIRLICKQALDKGTEVELLFSGVGMARPLKRLAQVSRVSACEDGSFCLGVQFDRRLNFAELQRLTRPVH